METSVNTRLNPRTLQTPLLSQIRFDVCRVDTLKTKCVKVVFYGDDQPEKWRSFCTCSEWEGIFSGWLTYIILHMVSKPIQNQSFEAVPVNFFVANQLTYPQMDMLRTILGTSAHDMSRLHVILEQSNPTLKHSCRCFQNRTCIGFT